MDNLKNIDDVIFWQTKSNIILTQYAMKDRKVGRFVRARYYNNIKSFTSDPTDRDIIEEHLIREKWLKDLMTISDLYRLQKKVSVCLGPDLLKQRLELC